MHVVTTRRQYTDRSGLTKTYRAHLLRRSFRRAGRSRTRRWGTCRRCRTRRRRGQGGAAGAGAHPGGVPARRGDRGLAAARMSLPCHRHPPQGFRAAPRLRLHCVRVLVARWCAGQQAGHHPLGPTPPWPPSWGWPTRPPTRCTRRWTGCSPPRRRRAAWPPGIWPPADGAVRPVLVVCDARAAAGAFATLDASALPTVNTAARRPTPPSRPVSPQHADRAFTPPSTCPRQVGSPTCPLATHDHQANRRPTSWLRWSRAARPRVPRWPPPTRSSSACSTSQPRRIAHTTTPTLSLRNPRCRQRAASAPPCSPPPTPPRKSSPRRRRRSSTPQIASVASHHRANASTTSSTSAPPLSLHRPSRIDAKRPRRIYCAHQRATHPCPAPRRALQNLAHLNALRSLKPSPTAPIRHYTPLRRSSSAR